MSAVSLTLLGGFELTLPPAVHVHLPTRKAQALLAYLALQPEQAQPRDKLAALLWGDVADAQARASLRQTLSLLGKALEHAPAPCLVTEARSVGVVAGAIEVGVRRFETAIAGGTPAALERAAQLYRGELLEGLVLDEATFESWLLGERERLRELAIEGLAKLLGHHQGPHGSAERAIQTAVRLLALDPCQEVVHRALMRLYARQGRHAAALRQYQVCVTALRRELNAEPDAETKRLYRDVLQRQTPAASAAAPPPDTVSLSTLALAEAPARETPLIGRDAELERLQALRREAWSGTPRVAVVLGEAGIGKTRLVEELAVEAGRAGGRAVVGRCYETEQILPFAPWVEAFRAAGVPEDTLLVERLPMPARQTLGRLFPAVVPPGVDIAREPENPLRLFEALTQLAGALAARDPLLVVLEDLHWADDMTLRLLAFLGRRLPASARLLVVGTAREEDVVQVPVLRKTLDELAAHDSFTAVPLGALTSAHTAELVRALTTVGAREPAVAELAAQIWRSSEGNPFVAVETTRAIEDGVLPASSDAVALPGSVRDLIVRRLERLSASARQLAGVSAVARGTLDFPLIQRASGLSLADAAEGLEELVRHRVFHGVGHGFDFTHDRVRQVAYTGLLAPRRDLLHGAIAEALEALHEGALDRVYDRLAYHYARTDRSEKAVEYLARFAEQAARGFAHADAAAALEQALVTGERLPVSVRDARLVELSLRLGFSLSLLGRFRDILSILGAYRERVDRLDRPDLAGPYHFRVGLTHTYLNEQARAGESGLAALEHARRAGDTTTMGRAHYLLALKDYWVGEPRDGVVHAREAVRLLDGSEDRHFFGLAYWILGLNHLVVGAFEPALTAARALQRIGHAMTDPRLLSFAAASIGWTQAMRGEADAGAAACLEAVDLARDPVSHALAHGYLGYAYVAQGNPAAIATLERAAEALGRLKLPHLVSRARTWLAEAYLATDDVKTARQLAETAFAEAGDYWFSVSWGARVLARIAYAEGDVAAAEARLETSLAIFTRVGAAFEVGRTHLVVAELARRRDDRAATRRHLAEAARWLEHLDVPRYHERLRALAEPW